MQTALQIIEIVVAVAIILVTLLQVKGGGIGGIFGQADTVYRTKRGLEKWLFYATIVLVVLFVILAIAMIRLA
jgi:preprotein translocase subunit SecG